MSPSRRSLNSSSLSNMPSGFYIRRNINLCFFDKVIKTDSCWLWIGARNQLKYGVFRNTGAHRFSFELANGKIPNGLHVCHSCDVPNCVNPAHLFLGNPKINSEDKVQKNRQARGEMFGERNKLNRNKVLAIRKLKGRRQAEIANLFGITQSSVSRIMNNKHWK